MTEPHAKADADAQLARDNRALRRSFLACALLLGAAASYGLLRPATDTTAPPKASGKARIVSLAPAVTETLFALGAGDQVVGVSNYCHFPKEVDHLPRTGSAITPSYEAIARLTPTLIVTSDVAGEQLTPLSRIAKTERLPWLSLDEVIKSTVRLGQLAGREADGLKLGARMIRTLKVPVAPNAPRVLLAIDYGDTGSSDVWFIRDNSLHGAALRAAGGKNAVERVITAQPRLSVEELVRLDPDQIVVLVDGEHESTSTLGAFERLTPLRAVRAHRVGMVRMPGALDGGPRVLDLVEPLKQEIERLHELP